MMNKKVMISVHIADIHFGAIEPDRLYEELKIEFLNKIKKLPRIDLLIIDGDLFDKDLSFNSDNVYYLLKFWDKLIKTCKKKSCKYIRLIKGTKNHDHEQLSQLPIEYNDIDIKIINTVTIELIEEFNYKILYLPEEYIKDPKEYYKSYFNQEYDLITGHGQFEEVSYLNLDSEISVQAAPTFNSRLLSSICNGPIIFGHIHESMTFNDVYYVGSFTRWKQGENTPKGFFINLTNLKDKRKFRILPIENKMARKYLKLNIDDIMDTKEIEDVIIYINDYIRDNNIYKLRIEINGKDDSKYMAKLATLQSYLDNNKNINLDIKIDDIITKQEDEETEKIIEKYSYLFNNTEELSSEEKISRFIKDAYNYTIDSDKVNKLITNNNILNLLDEMNE